MMMPRQRPLVRRSQRGFTLMELLLATAIGSVVLLVIQTTFFGALRLHRTTHARLDDDRTVERTLAIIRRDLAGLMLPGGVLSGELQTTSFSSMTSGTQGDRVTPDLFTASGRIDGWTPFAEVQSVAYYLSQATGSSDGRDLIRVVTRNLLPVQETEPEETVLLQNVAAAEIMYFDGTGWVDTWDSFSTSTLPRALKVSLSMAPTERSAAAPAPVEIVVPLLVQTTTTQAETEEEAAGL
jgi:type II secretion system protein J